MGVVVVCVQSVSVFVSVSVVPAQIKRGRVSTASPFFSAAGTGPFFPAVAAWLLAPVASTTAPAIRYLAHPLLTATNISKKETKHQRRLPIDSEKYPGDTPLPFLLHHHCPVHHFCHCVPIDH